MLLALDIGNTNITLGVFNGEKLLHSWRVSTQNTRTEDEYGIIFKNLLTEADVKISSVIISSVVTELTEKTAYAIKKYLNVKAIIVDYNLKTGVSLKTDVPEEVGADRIANAAGAVVLYKAPVIVVDFGTATSFDIVNENKEFVGGIIAAGMRLQSEALGTKTSKLPKIGIEVPEHVIGRNTKEAMLSGIVRGHAVMIDGLLSECIKELGVKPVIVATGGYSSMIAPYLSNKFNYINPDLTLIGLNIIFNMNK